MTSLATLSTEELLSNWVTSRTGSHETENRIPVRLLEAFYELDEFLTELQADDIIRKSLERR